MFRPLIIMFARIKWCGEKQFKTGLNNILHIPKSNIHKNVTVIAVRYSCELFDWYCVSNGVYCCGGKLEGIVQLLIYRS
jgi:hypothetical protein